MKARKEIKEEAKSILKGRYGQAFIAMLIYGVIEYLGSWLLIYYASVIGLLVWAVIEVVITYNLLVYFVKFKRGESRKWS